MTVWQDLLCLVTKKGWRSQSWEDTPDKAGTGFPENKARRKAACRLSTQNDVKYHVALLVTCACMMYTTRLQALSLPGKECMLADYICVCDN